MPIFRMLVHFAEFHSPSFMARIGAWREGAYGGEREGRRAWNMLERRPRSLNQVAFRQRQPQRLSCKWGVCGEGKLGIHSLHQDWLCWPCGYAQNIKGKMRSHFTDQIALWKVVCSRDQLIPTFVRFKSTLGLRTAGYSFIAFDTPTKKSEADKNDDIGVFTFGHIWRLDILP